MKVLVCYGYIETGQQTALQMNPWKFNNHVRWSTPIPHLPPEDLKTLFPVHYKSAAGSQAWVQRLKIDFAVPVLSQGNVVINYS